MFFGKSTKRRGDDKGFSMVELAIVLAIIALIIGAVAVGKDLQRNAEYKRITNKFIGQWAQAYNQYYERTGVPIGDNLQVPTQRVGGGSTTNSSAGMAGANLVNEMVAKGIRVPQGRGRGTTAATGGEDYGSQYMYLDQAGIPHFLTVSFAHYGTATEAAGASLNGLVGNLMVIANVTPKLGATMDMMIDGIIEADAGFFRGSGADVWGHGNSAAAEEESEGNLTAAWKMNQ